MVHDGEYDGRRHFISRDHDVIEMRTKGQQRLDNGRDDDVNECSEKTSRRTGKELALVNEIIKDVHFVIQPIQEPDMPLYHAFVTYDIREENKECTEERQCDFVEKATRRRR
uniref:Helitron helicase n=1 Tax=Angiostrongylus cantonensis TaxID=6313 RepID=A0A0K0DII8_ANGCA